MKQNEAERMYQYNKFSYHLEVFEGVEVIKDKKFKRKRARTVQLPSSLKKIGCYSFYSNYLQKLQIPNNVSEIGSYAFYKNNLRSITFGDHLSIIGMRAFADNKIQQLKLNNELKEIGSGAFDTNNLSHIEIPESVEIIGNHAFYRNNIESVSLTSNIRKIGEHAFDDTVTITYDGLVMDSRIIQKLGCNNIIKIYNISKFISLDRLLVFSSSSLKIIPEDIDSIKGFLLNYKKYYEIIDILRSMNSFFSLQSYIEEDLFKLCYTLGLFKGKNYELIKNILKEYGSTQKLHEIWTSVKLTKYKPGFEKLFIDLYKNNSLEYKERNITPLLYNSYEKIKEISLKRHKELISNKNTERLRAINNNQNINEIEREWQYLKSIEKEISLEDIYYFLENNTFEIWEGNEPLKSVFLELAIHMEQKDFDIIQEIYEQAKNVSKNFYLPEDKVKEGISYKWLLSDDPLNIILGYLVNCCAKLYGVGEDIMRQSMINANIANLVLYDENKKVLGKATAYYHKIRDYILFNNAETKKIKAFGLKSETERKNEALCTILRATRDLVLENEKNGIFIHEVRMGMEHNDLYNTIYENGLKVEKQNLLANYDYHGYRGDANTPNGQAILYKKTNKVKQKDKRESI